MGPLSVTTITGSLSSHVAIGQTSGSLEKSRSFPRDTRAPPDEDAAQKLLLGSQTEMKEYLQVRKHWLGISPKRRLCHTRAIFLPQKKKKTGQEPKTRLPGKQDDGERLLGLPGVHRKLNRSKPDKHR